MIVAIRKSDKENKRFLAIFKNGKKTHFGQKGGKTFIDHKDTAKRTAYRARHKRDLLTDDPYRAGFLAYYLLWSQHTNLKDAVKAYNQEFFSKKSG